MLSHKTHRATCEKLDLLFDKNLIDEYKYYKTKRWDIILKNGKIIKLPTSNYSNSLIKFVDIYEKDSFKKFNIFDFRINGQLVIK